MGDQRDPNTDIMRAEDLGRQLPVPRELSLPGGASEMPPANQSIDYSQLPSYPRAGPDLPPRRRTDFLWEWAEVFAATVICGSGMGLLALVTGVAISVRLLVQGAALLETLRAVGMVTLAGFIVGAAFGLWIDCRRGLSRHIRGD